MAVHRDTFSVKTSGRISLENITSEVESRLADGKVRVGTATIHVPHTTTALAVNEDEPGLRNDILRLAKEVVEPLRRGGFDHDRVDDNAASHLTSVLLGNSLTLPFHDGRLDLGTWENLFLVELDGPRTRTVQVTAVGE
jgi:secondary thiamine-phosphate synthase enzyme